MTLQESLQESLAEFLHSKQLLVVLDNCEHLLEPSTTANWQLACTTISSAPGRPSRAVACSPNSKTFWLQSATPSTPTTSTSPVLLPPLRQDNKIRFIELVEREGQDAMLL